MTFKCLLEFDSEENKMREKKTTSFANLYKINKGNALEISVYVDMTHNPC